MTSSNLTVKINADVSRWVAGMRQAARAAHRVQLGWMPRRLRRQHLRRCDLCNPAAFPPPLAVDGHAYHRRTRNRRKRS